MGVSLADERCHHDINAITPSTFGRLTAASDPRILQFALKLHF
jgi:hypothetical protein